MKWLTVKLADIAIEMQPGFAKQPSQDGLGLPQLRTNNVSEDGRINLSTIKTVVASENEIAKYSLQARDIIFNNTNSPALVGKTAFFEENGHFLFSNHMTRIRVREDVVDAKFISKYLHWIWMQGGFRNLVTQWVNQAAINRIQLSRLSISLPPISEQRRIVEILDQADALRKMRAEADAKAERILPALFIKMFGDPATNSMGWEEKKLSDLNIDFRYGTSVKCDYRIKGLPVLRIPNILGGEINLDALKYGELSSEETNRLLLQQGDLLFVRTNGNPDYVGRCAVFDLDEPYLFASYLIRARFPRDTVESRFIAAYLQTPSGRQGMLPFIRTTAGQSNISVEGLKNIPIFLPDIELQRNFVNQLDNLYKLRRQREQSKSLLESIFQSLLSRAFSGELTAKWREAHMKELLAEMEEQAKALNLRDNADPQQLSLL